MKKVLNHSVSSSSIRTIALLLFLLPTAFCYAQSSYKYNIEKVLDNIYVLKPDINKYRWVTSNIVVIVNEKDVVIVDSGLLPAAADEAIKEIRKITNKPVRYLVNTHWHGDHWQGNEAFAREFPKIEIVSTEQGYKAISRNGMVWAKLYYPRYFKKMIANYESGLESKSIDGKALNDAEQTELKEGIAAMKKDLEGIMQLQPKLPTMTYSENMSIFCGNREIRLMYLGIGNTNGDAVIYLPAEKVLIPGDLVVFPSPYESGMFSPEWLETSKKLTAIDYQYLIPGHGDVQKDHEYLNYLNALFEEIIRQISGAYVNGSTHFEEIKEIVTHKSVMDELNKKPAYKKFTEMLESDFVPAAIHSSYLRIIQGKE